MTTKRKAAKGGSGGKDAGHEYKSFLSMGFLSLEEVDSEESAAILAAAGKSATKLPKVAVAERFGGGDAAPGEDAPKAAPAKRQKGHAKGQKEAPASAVLPDAATAAEEDEAAAIDLPGWATFSPFIDARVLAGIQASGFDTPTEIQQKVLACLCKDAGTASLLSTGGEEGARQAAAALATRPMARRDILGSAPTGSGKTLAFLLPILSEVMRRRRAAVALHPTEATGEVSKESVVEASKEDATDASKEGVVEAGKGLAGSGRVTALIIVPTRELALQIREHLQRVSVKVASPPIRAVALVGGLSQEKQERLLAYGADVIVATPGRLAEVLEGSDPLKKALGSDISFLVLDEADRLVEKGHFEDLNVVFDHIFAVENKKRQTFLFSATLPKGQCSLSKLRKRIPFNDRKPVIVSLATVEDSIAGNVAGQAKEAAAKDGKMSKPSSLTHYQLECLAEEKTLYLVALLSAASSAKGGRSLVFVNTIELVKDLATLLCMFGINATCLHAQMQQRQRIKNLERFKNAQPSTGGDGRGAVLVTSDVAARGLDIPKVDRVIHYHIPKAIDVFVHRSGRTARANAPGSSIAILSPHEYRIFERIKQSCHLQDSSPAAEASSSSGKAKKDGNALVPYPLDGRAVEAYRKAVAIGERLFKVEAKGAKAVREKTWEAKAAEALGVTIDDPRECRSKYDVDDDNYEARMAKKKSLNDLSRLRASLQDALKQAQSMAATFESE